MKLRNTISGSTVSVDDELGDELLAGGGWEKAGARRNSSSSKSTKPKAGDVEDQGANAGADTTKAKAGNDGSDTGSGAASDAG